jgi:hypothetical protein
VPLGNSSLLPVSVFFLGGYSCQINWIGLGIMQRFHQLLFAFCLVGLCWLAIQAMHELGHVMGALVPLARWNACSPYFHGNGTPVNCSQASMYLARV